MDLGFDLRLELAGRKELDKVRVAFKPDNFRSNKAPEQGKEGFSGTLDRIMERISESIAGEASPGPVFNPTFEAPNPGSFDGQIRYLRIRIDQGANVVIGVASGA